MKNKKILFILIFAMFILLLFTTKSNASLYLNELNFEAKINYDGTMDVKEIWDIDISDTNTLYKTFEIDTSKYSNITNIEVREITDGASKYFTETNTWAYHLTEDYYFGGINNDRKFEIAWGVGLDTSSDTRKYEITYTVTDAIAKYNDCAELYWQFIGEDFEVSANKVKGTITLPSKANSKDDIKVWGHIETLNGEIYVTDLDEVTFTVNNYSGGRYLEVRVAMPEDMIIYTGREYNKAGLSNIISEETEWANEANARRIRNKIIETIILGIVLIVGLVLTVFMATKTNKYRKILKEMNKYKPTMELDYFRELPDETATPADAVFVKEERKK